MGIAAAAVVVIGCLYFWLRVPKTGHLL